MNFPALDCRKEHMKGSNNKDSCVLYCFHCGAFNCSIDPRLRTFLSTLRRVCFTYLFGPEIHGSTESRSSSRYEEYTVSFWDWNTYYKQTSITLLFLSQQTTALAISMESEVNRKSLTSQAKVIIRYQEHKESSNGIKTSVMYPKKPWLS